MPTRLILLAFSFLLIGCAQGHWHWTTEAGRTCIMASHTQAASCAERCGSSDGIGRVEMAHCRKACREDDQARCERCQGAVWVQSDGDVSTDTQDCWRRCGRGTCTIMGGRCVR